MDSPILETALGLVFIFAVFSALLSLLSEQIARFIGLRGEFLLRGIRSMVDGDSRFKLSVRDMFRRKPVAPSPDAGPARVTEILQHPLIASTVQHGAVPAHAGNIELTAKQRRALPAYVSARTFSRALLGVVVPDSSGQHTIAVIRHKVKQEMDDTGLRTVLLQLLDESEGKVEQFRRGLEAWYDDQMARVSGWYQRYVRWIAVVLGFLIVIVFNVNAIEVSRSLYTDEALRASVVAQAAKTTDCENRPAQCIEDLRADFDGAGSSGLPIGWSTAEECALPGSSCSWWDERGLTDPTRNGGHDVLSVLLVLLGWALMVLALLPGARFWFDALSRLGTLRSTGPKPTPTAADG